MKQTEKHTITNEFTETNGYISSCKEKTAEVRPIVRAKWVDRPDPRWNAFDTRYCSECEWSISMNILRDIDSEWNYCPNCGAFMHLIDEKRRGE